MDHVTCEGPLDNSFQKDRRELVNKGSLGRRRKPSRSNLKLILSPTSDDTQDTVVFNSRRQSETSSDILENCTSTDHLNGSFLSHQQEIVTIEKLNVKQATNNQQQQSVKYNDSHCHQRNISDYFQENGTTPNHIIETDLSNQQESATVDQFPKKRSNCNPLQNIKSCTPHLAVASNNYQEVIDSINKLRRVNGSDCNGNNEKTVSVSNNYHNTVPPIDHENVINSKQQLDYRIEINNVNSRYHPQVTVNSQCQNVNSNKHQENVTGARCSTNKSNSCLNTIATKSQVPDSKIHQQTLNAHNQQKTVASRNHQNTVTFSNRRQIVTSTPIQTKTKVVTNGKHNGLVSQDVSSKLRIEPTLPRTSDKPNLVAEAQQFSVEAKLKLKKSEVPGRSAVLIQTWERRTQSDSLSKRKDSKPTSLKNRFVGKESNTNVNSRAMPDSYICSKYKGSLQNGVNLKTGKLVREEIPDETMLYRIPDNTHGRFQPPRTPIGKVVNGKLSSSQEPEWISLSKKLCAKFVEGHIEPHSPDSYLQEEPEGVREEPVSSPQTPTHLSDTNLVRKDVQKKKISVSTPDEDEILNSNEPPWIHLSRKLCNKFIEEHIEYPPITNGHFVEVPELVEPNGDVRIIEKVGKPKGRKSKQKKECEPEWVSISKKLRAKFIESHIDDPDTISLDNQLNVSDPEETGSESLSDMSQDIVIPKRMTGPVEAKNDKNFTRSQHEKKDITYKENFDQLEGNNSVNLPEKECCWEYQEMEFDQESNSGNFHEVECYEEPLQEARIRRGSLPEDDSDDFTVRENVSFDKTFQDFQTPECYNNDVMFAPRCSDDDTHQSNHQQNKLFTVQFIAHADDNAKRHRQNSEIENNPHCRKGGTIHGSFFNLSTWEEAHCQQENTYEPISCKKESLCKDLRSKSLDNIYDSLDDRLTIEEDCSSREDKNSANGTTSKENFESKPKESLNEEDTRICFEDFEPDPLSSSKVPSANKNADNIREEPRSESEARKKSSSRFHCQEKKQNIPFKAHDAESSSDDEVFDCTLSSGKYSPDTNHYGKISPQKSPCIEKEKPNKKQQNNERVEDATKKSDKNFKCNGMIPNSIYSDLPKNEVSFIKQNQTEKLMQKDHKEPVKLGMSKWITISRSEQNINKNEYSNLPSYSQVKQNDVLKSTANSSDPKEIKLEKNYFEKRYIGEERIASSFSKDDVSQKHIERENKNDCLPEFTGEDTNSNLLNGPVKEFDLKHKCKSLCDISYNRDSFHDEDNFRHHESVADLASASQKTNSSKIEFQHFEFEAEIPLCAKLVSNQNRKKPSKKNISSISPSNRTESPCPSESSHVYEDMFKETPSGPSDSEASSWTAMKNSSYYVNGRSSSMNDLDYSDSCSMSVKCDYASSSENSTLQSRHSSYASSSFYVNLRDYDSHMLEPSLNKAKRNNDKVTSNGNSSSISKSNPPTPESLRHLFTSPLSSIHSPPNVSARLMNRMPSDPQSHYYSTAAAATSSAFKHGFAVTPPKPKKAERSSSIKIKDIAHGIILTFKRFQNHSKNSNVSPTHYVDVSHLAEMNSNSNSESVKSKKNQKDSKKQSQDKGFWAENGKTDTDSGFLSDVQKAKARRSSSDLTDMKSNSDILNKEKKKSKGVKKNSNREKGKKSRSKVSEPKPIPTVSRKVQQMADGTLYLVTTVSGDTSMPGVYSDSPDTSSELSTHRPVKLTGESNC